MNEIKDQNNVKEIALAIDMEIRALAVKNAPNLRAIRRKYSRKLEQAHPKFILELAREIFENYGYRWISYDLIRNHK